MTSETLAKLRSLAEAAIAKQVHPANWDFWAKHVLERGPARDFVEAASPQTLLALLDLAQLSVAWSRVEAALPDGWWLDHLKRRGTRNTGYYWSAVAYSQEARLNREGPTPTLALLALSEKLEAREP